MRIRNGIISWWMLPRILTVSPAWIRAIALWLTAGGKQTASGARPVASLVVWLLIIVLVAERFEIGVVAMVGMLLVLLDRALEGLVFRPYRWR